MKLFHAMLLGISKSVLEGHRAENHDVWIADSHALSLGTCKVRGFGLTLSMSTMVCRGSTHNRNLKMFKSMHERKPIFQKNAHVKPVSQNKSGWYEPRMWQKYEIKSLKPEKGVLLCLLPSG